MVNEKYMDKVFLKGYGLERSLLFFSIEIEITLFNIDQQTLIRC